MALDNNIRILINELANAVRSYFDVEVPIKNIEDIVSKMGGVVIENPNMDCFSDGKIQRTGNETFTIEVSPYQSQERKNFTIAHEIGHLFLHMGFIVDEDKWNAQGERVYYRNGNSREEYFANEFAAAFLMPKIEYKRVMDENTEGNTVNTQEIAKYFNVSTEAASNRGKWLGYLQW